MKQGVIILVNAVIWGLVMIGCSLALKGTGMYEKIQLILAGGALVSLMLLSTRAIGKKTE